MDDIQSLKKEMISKGFDFLESISPAGSAEISVRKKMPNGTIIADKAEILNAISFNEGFVKLCNRILEKEKQQTN